MYFEELSGQFLGCLAYHIDLHYLQFFMTVNIKMYMDVWLVIVL